ncbi:ATP-dependent DNA helicase [Mycoplasma mycoides]|uniref:ATP-dependent DNA helicase n=1 Tax=Mycoplasma mycoides TaxID=2102 RepID=UPI00223F8EF3|nr:AAA family ATPase [Mycoplasma mycoides]QVK09615.1 AAA family ATPase [Mycoplasma mycoides subsp. capri]
MLETLGYIKKFTSIKDNKWAVAEFLILKDNKLIKISGFISDMVIGVLYHITLESNPKSKNNQNIFQCKFYKIQDMNKNMFIDYLNSDVFIKCVNSDLVNIISTNYTCDYIKEILFNKDQFLNIDINFKSNLKNIYKKLSNIYKFAILESEFTENNLDLFMLKVLKEQDKQDNFSFEEILDILTNNIFYFNYLHNIVDFQVVDKIFLHFNKNRYSVTRIAYYLHYYCCKILTSKHSTYTSMQCIKNLLIKDKILSFLEQQNAEDLINNAIDYAIKNKLFIIKKEKVYTYQTYIDELNIAWYLTRKKKVKKLNHFKFKKYVNQIEQEVRKETNIETFKYDPSQVIALKKFINNRFIAITGGPGTGKTTLIKGLVKLFKKVYPNSNFRIATPTGRAAARIKESFEESNATTIHKLLQYDPETEKFKKNQDYPLDYDLLIIDETSMVGNNLFSQFISAIGQAKKIVFVGDINQLPSVEIGNAFEDIIKSKKITTVELKSTHRQANNSKIVELAYMIKDNNFDLKKLYENQAIENQSKTDLQTIFVDNQEQCLKEIINNYNLDNKTGFDEPYKIQIISPFKDDILGIKDINTFIQNNRFKQEKLDQNTEPCIQMNNSEYYQKDKVMYLRNENDLSNGDIGVIQKIHKDNNELKINFNDKIFSTINNASLKNLTLCYACTVHKTQGSEFEKVILVLDPKRSNFFIDKKLIYTAVTRAKKQLVIIASKNSFINGINKNPEIRDTTLVKHIKLMYKKRKKSHYSYIF